MTDIELKISMNAAGVKPDEKPRKPAVPKASDAKPRNGSASKPKMPVPKEAKVPEVPSMPEHKFFDPLLQ